MTLAAVVGQAQGMDGREAGSEAALQALNQLGKISPGFGFILASHDYPIQEVLDGVSAPLGNTPLLGFSTSAELTQRGQARRSVVVSLLAGNDIQMKADWWPAASENNSKESIAQAAKKMLETLQPEENGGIFLVIADGLIADTSQIEKHLAAMYKKQRQVVHDIQPKTTANHSFIVSGCLSSGDLRHKQTFQIGGQKSGSMGIAGGLISGKITAGVGKAHGWLPVGNYFKITQAHGPWIHTLDDRPVCDVYAELFGYQPHEWGIPPLNELVRLYPFGIEQRMDSGENGIRMYSPLYVETDGTLRMNANIPEGSVGHWMVGSADGCLDAAKEASRKALSALADARDRSKPALAILLVDTSWEIILEGQPGAEIQAVQSVLGNDIPIIGGYTLGQISTASTASHPELLNSHIVVLLLSE